MVIQSYFEKQTAVILELGFRQDNLPALESYLLFLWKSNEELNLFSRKMTAEELIDNHVIDCLLALRYFPSQISKAADFGSGGGLPAVIYALQFPHIDYHLFEKSPKKQAFLTKCRSFAPNMIIHGEIPEDLKGVELITARAFKPLDVILQMSRPFYERGGRYFLLKGRLQKIEEEIELAKQRFKDVKASAQPLNSPILEVERHLLQVERS